MNGNNKIRIADGSQVPQIDEIVYLGGILTSKISITNEILNRIAATINIWMNLHIFCK